MRCSLSLLASLFFALTATAETRLVLGNGDTLRGKVVKIEDGILHFDAEALGILALPASGVTIESTDPNRSAEGEILAAASAGTAATVRPKSDAQADETEADQRPEIRKKPGWKKNVEFGFSMQSGRRDKLDVSARFTAQRNLERDQYRVKARYLYGQTNSEVSTDLFDSSFRWRRDMDPRFFTQALTFYRIDDIKHINHDFSQGVGVGRKLYNLDTFSFSLGGGATARYRDENGDPPGWNYMVDAFQDIDYQINDRFKVVQDASLLIEPEDTDNYEFNLTAALIGKVSETVTMSMRYEYEYDNSLNVDSRLSQRIITSLGYLF